MEELKVILGELHQLPEGARLHPRSVTAHILLKVHRLNHLRQGQLSINIRLLCTNNYDMALMMHPNLISRSYKVQWREETGCH